MLGVLSKNQFTNYRVFLAADMIGSLAFGLFWPFWIIFIKDFRPSDGSFGIAAGTLVLAYSGTAYLVGKFSDKFGRKKFMVGAGLAFSLVILSYTLINSLAQLYTLQATYGIIIAISGTTKSAFLGDITEKATRGKDVGKWSAVTGVATAVGMIGGGVVASDFDFTVIFYVVAGIFFVSSLLLLLIEER